MKFFTMDDLFSYFFFHFMLKGCIIKLTKGNSESLIELGKFSLFLLFIFLFIFFFFSFLFFLPVSGGEGKVGWKKKLGKGGGGRNGI